MDNKNNEQATFLGDLMLWCFKWGCEIQLRNKAYNYPLIEDDSPYRMGEYHEVQSDGSIVDLEHHTKIKRIQIPELIFKKGDRHISFSAMTWEDLIDRFKYEHKRIYMELSVPMFGG